MKAEGIAPLSEPDFTASAEQSDHTLTARLNGTADLRVKDPLDRFLHAVHEEASRCGARQVVVDFRSLEFMNSSCLKTFVDWISNLADAPPENQYRIVLVSNPAMHWQKRSLHALSCFASDLVTVQT